MFVSLLYEELLVFKCQPMFLDSMFRTYGDLRKAISCGQMQARVAFVLKVGVAQLVRVVPDDALHQRQVVEQDGTAQTPGYINPDYCQSRSHKAKI
jgi:hypothetical protein